MKIKASKIKEELIKLPRFLATHAFLSFLALLFLALIFGGVVWYKYESLAQKEKPQVLISHLKFKEDVFENVLKAWEEREKRFKEADFKEYSNPFEIPLQKLIPTTTTSTSTPL